MKRRCRHDTTSLDDIFMQMYFIISSEMMMEGKILEEKKKKSERTWKVKRLLVFEIFIRISLLMTQL